jgi:hypothetical protein
LFISFFAVEDIHIKKTPLFLQKLFVVAVLPPKIIIFQCGIKTGGFGETATRKMFLLLLE